MTTEDDQVRAIAMSRLGMGAMSFLYFLIVASSGYSGMVSCVYLTCAGAGP